MTGRFVSPLPWEPVIEPVARGVWCVRGGFPKRGMNVFLLEDEGGVTMFDAGIRDMTHGLKELCERMGGLKRIVLGHAHPDHRGTAPGLGAPVYCHPEERAYAEGDGGMSDWRPELLDWYGRWLIPMNSKVWDGGPVTLEGTVEEGDEVAGFRVVHLPGHSPGMIGLWREEDRLALVTDAFYLLDPQTTLPGDARTPHACFNLDSMQARGSIRKLAELEPREAWPGHIGPLTGDVRGTLERVAEQPVPGEQ